MLPPVQDAPWHFFSRQSKDVVISPRPVDVNETFLQTLEPEAEFFDDAEGRRVFGSDVDLNSVESDVVEEIVGHEGHCGWCDTATRHLGRYPVTDGRTGDRTEKHIGHVQLPDDFAVNLDHKRHALVSLKSFQETSHHRFDIKRCRAVG